ncbi:hypothetical protein ACVWWO_006489 [Bradyrhizobium sp. F1.13.1]
MAAADQHRAVLELLEGQFAPAQDHDGVDEMRHARSDHQHRRHGLDRNGLTKRRCDGPGPGAGGIDEHRRGKALGADIDVPEAIGVPDVRGGNALAHGRTELLRLATERRRRLRGIGGAVAARDHTAGTALGDCGHEASQLGRIDRLLVGEAERVELGHTCATHREFLLVLGDEDLAIALKATIVVEEIGDLLPDSHRADRKRDFGDVPRKLAHAACVDAGGVPAGIVLLDQHGLQAGETQMQRSRAPVDAAADDDRIHVFRHPRTTALMSSSLFGTAASSASVIGLTGARSR